MILFRVSRIRAKVNVLCIAAVMLGVVSLLLPMASLKVGSMTIADVYLIRDGFLGGQYLDPVFMMVCSFFVAGLFLLIVTPAAGFLELAGALGILMFYPAGLKDAPGDPSLALGAIAALGSAILAVLSFYLPIGPGYGSPRRGRYIGQANRFLTASRLDSAAKFRINLLCLAGALMAMAAMGLSWFTHQTVSAEPVITTYDRTSLFMFIGQDLGVQTLLAALVFLGGSAAAFVTPLGGFAQVFGIFWFWQARYVLVGTLAGSDWIDKNYFDSGFYLGIVASALVLSSMFLPLGIGYILRRKTLRTRLIIWGEPAARL